LKERIEKLLRELGEDPSREGLQKTPERVEKSFKYLTSGYGINIEQLANDALYQEDYDEMIIVKDIDIYSLCEHHLLPFGQVAYMAFAEKGQEVMFTEAVDIDILDDDHFIIVFLIKGVIG
jgi:GTP cyclohydrolase I